MKSKFSIVLFFTLFLLFLNSIINKELKLTNNQTEVHKDLNTKNPPDNNSDAPKKEREREEFVFTVKKNDTLYNIMKHYNFSNNDIYNVSSLSKAFYDLNNIKIGSKIKFIADQNSSKKPDTIEIKISESKILRLSQNTITQKWSLKTKNLPIEYKIETFEGTIHSSLWESAEEQNLNNTTIFNFSSIFAWQIDFDREVRKNHSWKILLEKKLINGTPTKNKKILYAEYKTFEDVYQAIRFPQDTEKAEYYDAKGNNLKSLFLKSPIQFGRISSTFQRKRFHPILKINRPHYGIDYAAPSGTPILVVGDGIIEQKGYSRSSGNYIVVRHNSMYKTAYRHLKGFVRGLKKHQKVTQGQTIGYVGSTGLATGPHLHFEFHENGKFVDPLGKKFPRKKPLAKEHTTEFMTITQSLQQKLYSELNRKKDNQTF